MRTLLKVLAMPALFLLTALPASLVFWRPQWFGAEGPLHLLSPLLRQEILGGATYVLLAATFACIVLLWLNAPAEGDGNEMIQAASCETSVRELTIYCYTLKLQLVPSTETDEHVRGCQRCKKNILLLQATDDSLADWTPPHFAAEGGGNIKNE